MNPRQPVRQPRGTGPLWGAQWRDPTMAGAYRARFAYPPDTFELLAALRHGDVPVCEIGAGSGRLTLGLARRVGRVDAIEPSTAMVRAALDAPELSGGDVRWIVAPFEDATLDGPYSLMVASDAIHWLDWGVAFPMIAEALEPGGFLALVGQDELEPGTDERTRVRSPEVIALINEFSSNHEYEPYDVIESLRDAGVFEPAGTAFASRVTVRESVEHVITRLHSMNGLAPAALGDRLAAFDARARELLGSLATSGQIVTDVRPAIAWGYPVAAARDRTT